MRSPRRFLRALRLALRIGWRGERPLFVHLAYLAEACLLTQWLEGLAIHHLHAHFSSNSAAIAMLARALGGPSYSFTVHGQEEILSGGIHEKIKRAAFVVAISSFGRALLYRRSDPEDWNKIHLVHTGLDTSFLDCEQVPLPESARLVCVGRLGPEKGQLLLIEAIALLEARGVACELVLAGDGEMRPHIEARVRKLGLEGRVRITGWIDGNGVRGEILAARGLVLSSFTEGLPVALMEAMALRRAVIAPFVGGIPELVRPGVDGWLVPAGSVECLALAMEELLSAPDVQLQRMGEAGRVRVLERHSAQREATKLADLFRLYAEPRCAESLGEHVSGQLPNP